MSLAWMVFRSWLLCLCLMRRNGQNKRFCSRLCVFGKRVVVSCIFGRLRLRCFILIRRLLGVGSGFVLGLLIMSNGMTLWGFVFFNGLRKGICMYTWSVINVSMLGSCVVCAVALVWVRCCMSGRLLRTMRCICLDICLGILLLSVFVIGQSLATGSILGGLTWWRAVLMRLSSHL